MQEGDEMKYTPSQIIAIEEFREMPFSCMFGCCETETVAKNIITWLSKNSDDWDTGIPELGQFGTLQQLSHGHWGYDAADAAEVLKACNFATEFIDATTGKLNEEFIAKVHRGYDGRRYKKSVLHKLRPDLFPEE